MANSGTGENSGHFPDDSKIFKELFRTLNKQFFVNHTQRPNQAIVGLDLRYFISIVYSDNNLFKTDTTGFETALAKSATMKELICEFGYEEPKRFNTVSEVVEEVLRLRDSVDAKLKEMAEQRYPDRYPVDLKQIK